MTEYKPARLFDPDNIEFRRGFEVALLWHQCNTRINYISEIVHWDITEMIMRIAEANHYTYAAVGIDDTYATIEMVRIDYD